jgi:hypothetical protein
MRALGAALLAAATLLGGCRPGGARSAAATTIERCEYTLSLAASGLVRADAQCWADGELTFRAEPSRARDVHSKTAGAGGRFRAERGQLSYELDLSRVARRAADIDSAAQVGGSFVAPMSTVLLVPEPLTTEIPVKVKVVAPEGLQVAVGLARDSAPDTYRLMAHEIPVATYFSFGKLQQRTLEVGSSTLELSHLDGALDRSTSDVGEWVATSARAVADFYGTFPVARASVTVIPVPRRDEVVFGKVLPESEPGIALLLGEHTSRKALYSDWILVHELFHLGFPSFYDEGKWLDEGLATYYEPIIRVRAGLYTETELWSELEENLPQGLPAYTELGLEQARDFRGVYWGGALACLEADVRARKRRTNVGLEVGLRALRDAGGTASEVWSLADAMAIIDRALGEPTLAPIAEQHGSRGSEFDLAALLGQLGVTRDAQGNIRLSDTAPLAAVRRAITAKP